MNTYSLIKIVDSIAKDADASNNISVSYFTPEIEIIAGNISIEHAQEKLQAIEDEIFFFKEIMVELRKAFKSSHKKTTRNKEIEYVNKLIESKNPYLKDMYFRDGVVLSMEINKKLQYLEGEYLIIPSIYKKL